MAVSPHPITVTVYQDDNSTVKAGAKVIVSNTTKGTTLEATNVTNSSGLTLVDLQNLPDPSSGNKYDDGDKILIVTYSGNQHDAAEYTVSGNSKAQTLYLNPAKFHNKVISLKNIITAETAGTVAYVKVLDFSDGELIAHIETPPNDTKNIHIEGGIQRNYVLVREANTLIVTTIQR